MTTIVNVRDAAPRDMTTDVFADITPSAFTVTWKPPDLAVTFDADLTAAQVLSVNLRIRALNANEETILRQAWVALQANRDYLAGAQMQAAVVAQVAALTRQVNGILRRVLNLYDGTD